MSPYGFGPVMFAKTVVNVLAALIATGVGYLALGYVGFQYCQQWVRREGVMAHY